MLRPPKLDDRNFEQLVAMAKERLARACPDWTDHGPADPGITLVEAFAYLTEVLLYRVNRLPEKVYIELLRLLGLRLEPPAAASVELILRLATPRSEPIVIKKDTRVVATRPGSAGGPPVFWTLHPVTIAAGEIAATVTAVHAEPISAELLGIGTGRAGQALRVARPPIVGRPGTDSDFVLAVEASETVPMPDARAVRVGEKSFVVWSEVASFADGEPDQPTYVVDRATGRVMFAPAVRQRVVGAGLEERPSPLGLAPPAQREIRVWYRTGGGIDGNVAADTLTRLEPPIAGVSVTNGTPATGGRAAESMENALRRGPLELHALDRAVTAQDFELIAARNSGAIARAKAFTAAMIWRHAQPGTIELLLVPDVPEGVRVAGRVTAELLEQHQTKVARGDVQAALDRRRPLGTTLRVGWARGKSVSVHARIVVGREEDPEAVRIRLEGQLARRLSPVPFGPAAAGWGFGESLHDWHVYELLRSEPSVRWVDTIELVVDAAPSRAVTSLVRDGFQSGTWFAAAEGGVFRSSNDGNGWELVGTFAAEAVALVRAFPSEVGTGDARAGHVVAVTRAPEGPASRVWVSRTCGESWHEAARLEFRVEDAAWIERPSGPALLLATEKGLYELGLQADAGPVPVLVESSDQGLGFHAVVAVSDATGETQVVVASMGERGVYLSRVGGQRETFQRIGLDGKMVRRLAVQRRGPHLYLWAGLAVPGDAPGDGCRRFRLSASGESGVWESFEKGWRAGSCRGLAVAGGTVLAATRIGGVLRLDSEAREPEWRGLDPGCGLPQRAERGFELLEAVACDTEGAKVMACGAAGIFLEVDASGRFKSCSEPRFERQVTLPPTWLLCSGEHRVEVVAEDDTVRGGR